MLSFDALNVMRDFTLLDSAELIDLSNWIKTEGILRGIWNKGAENVKFETYLLVPAVA